jgi:hypothetical protein
VANPVGLEVPQQLDHRHEGARQVRTLQQGMNCAAQPLAGFFRKAAHAHSDECAFHRPQQQTQIGLVPVIVLDHRLAEPAVIALQRSPVRLAAS